MSRNTMGGGGGGGVDGVIAIYEDLSHRWAAPLFAGGKADPPESFRRPVQFIFVGQPISFPQSPSEVKHPILDYMPSMKGDGSDHTHLVYRFEACAGEPTESTTTRVMSLSAKLTNPPPDAGVSLETHARKYRCGSSGPQHTIK